MSNFGLNDPHYGADLCRSERQMLREESEANIEIYLTHDFGEMVKAMMTALRDYLDRNPLGMVMSLEEDMDIEASLTEAIKDMDMLHAVAEAAPDARVWSCRKDLCRKADTSALLNQVLAIIENHNKLTMGGSL